MEELYLPTLHYFAMENIFTGSKGDFRFRIKPQVVKKTPKEVDMENSTLEAQCWHGPFCYEKSQMESTSVFPMTEEGREEMRTWLIDNI